MLKNTFLAENGLAWPGAVEEAKRRRIQLDSQPHSVLCSVRFRSVL